MTDLPPRSDDDITRRPDLKLRSTLDEFLGGPGETRRLGLVLIKGLGITIVTLAGAAIVWSALRPDQPNRPTAAGRTETELLVSGNPARRADPGDRSQSATYGAGGANQSGFGTGHAGAKAEGSADQTTVTGSGGPGTRRGGNPKPASNDGGIAPESTTTTASIPPTDVALSGDAPASDEPVIPEPAVGADQPALEGEGGDPADEFDQEGGSTSGASVDQPPAGPETGPDDDETTESTALNPTTPTTADDEAPETTTTTKATTTKPTVTTKPTTSKVTTSKPTTSKATTSKPTTTNPTTTKPTSSETTETSATAAAKATTKTTSGSTTKSTAATPTPD